MDFQHLNEIWVSPIPDRFSLIYLESALDHGHLG